MIFFVNIRFTFSWILSKTFKEAILFRILNMLYMYKETLKAILFGLYFKKTSLPILFSLK